jgi:glycosyltransferase involved in cell wall biosynthesis
VRDEVAGPGLNACQVWLLLLCCRFAQPPSLLLLLPPRHQLLPAAAADVVMVNSSWTSAHIQQLWWSLKEPALVYPPCDTSDLQKLPLDRKLKHLYLVSVAQFRPEKNHRLQLEAFALARQRAAGACGDVAWAMWLDGDWHVCLAM